METSQLKILFVTFDDLRVIPDNGVEYWYANELAPVLGYLSQTEFFPIVEKAKISCLNAGGDPTIHFIVSKDLSGNILDYKLTRYACYLIAVNGDPQKQEIAFAQAYFITQTQRLEQLEERMEELARLNSRERLYITEQEFNSFVSGRGVTAPKQFAAIKARGDQELFGGNTTKVMKEKMGIPKDKSLADFLPNVTLKAKDLATAMTTENAKKKGLYGYVPLGEEHVRSNKSVRTALVSSNIYPEELEPGEDLKKIKMRHSRELQELRARQEKELKDAEQGKLL